MNHELNLPLPNEMALPNTGTSIVPVPLNGDISIIGNPTRFHPRYVIMSDGAVFDKIAIEMIERDQLEARGFNLTGGMIVIRETGEIIGTIPKKKLEPLSSAFDANMGVIKYDPKPIASKPYFREVLAEHTDLEEMDKSRLTPEESELFEMLTTCRDADSETEKAFIEKFIDTLPGVTVDTYGNRYVRVGDNPRLAFSCHTDSVHYVHGVQSIVFDKGTVSLAKHSESNCLGADCATGVWLMRHMVLANVPGLYLFHRKEESGMQGSKWIVRENPQALTGIQAVIAFDRMGYSSVITHQMGERTASVQFAESFIRAIEATNSGSQWSPLAYKIDTGGAYTDSAAYASMVPECTNISVGYHNQHSENETQNVDHATRLLRALRLMDWNSIVIARDPEIVEYDYERGTYGKVYKSKYGNRYIGLGPAEGYGQHGAWHDPQYDPTSPHDDAGRENVNYEKPFKVKAAMTRLQKERAIINSIVAEFPEEIADLLFYDFDRSPDQILDMLQEQCGFDPVDVLITCGYDPKNPYDDETWPDDDDESEEN